MKKFILLSGSSNRPLALKIAKELGVKLGRVEVEEFPNREIRIRVLEDVKNKNVFLIQSTIFPAERYLVELALIADAVKRNGAKKIVAIMPWFGYSPQDKVFRDGEPLSSKVVIQMLEASAIHEFVLVDIHSGEVLEMFKKKVHHLSAMSVFIDYFKGKLKGPSTGSGHRNWCSVALDNGALERAEEFSKKMRLPLVHFDKSRDRKTGEVTFHALKGDVNGKNVITFDDYVSTGGTTVKSCEFLKKEGARKCYYCITHLVVPETISKIEKSKIDTMFLTDSIRLDLRKKYKRVKVLSIASLLSRFIRQYVS